MVRNKLNICREYHIQPSEIDRLPYYEYEYLLEDIHDIQKKEEEERDKQNSQNGSMPKIPNLGQFKMPTVSIPKF